MLKRLIHDESGATAIEYTMIAGFIAIVIIAALTTVGVSLDGILVAVNSGFDGVAP
jgi:pilus assembly protein Flp/PilA